MTSREPEGVKAKVARDPDIFEA